MVDNPVVLPDGRVESTGNFHGAPLGFAADFLAIAAAEVGAIAERRVDRLLDVTRSRDLPAFLTPDAGVNSGLMIAQYTAAGIVAENRRLAAPASVDSLPTSGMQEDHVSMGWAATKKLRTVLDNLTSLLAVELLAARTRPAAAGPADAVAGRPAAVAALAAVAGEPGPDVFLAPVMEARGGRRRRPGAAGRHRDADRPAGLTRCSDGDRSRAAPWTAGAVRPARHRCPADRERRGRLRCGVGWLPVGMYGEYLRVTPDELARSIADPVWGRQLADSVIEAEFAEEPAEPRNYGTDKSWHGLQYLLQRAGFPLDIVTGEQSFVETAGELGRAGSGSRGRLGLPARPAPHPRAGEARRGTAGPDAVREAHRGRGAGRADREHGMAVPAGRWDRPVSAAANRPSVIDPTTTTCRPTSPRPPGPATPSSAGSPDGARRAPVGGKCREFSRWAAAPG